MKIFARIVSDIGTGEILEAESFEYQGSVALTKGGSGGSGSSTTEASIPPELRALYTQTGSNIQQAQNENPLSQYLGANPTRIAQLTGTQRQGINLMDRNLSDATRPLEESDIAQAGTRYFNSSIAPSITNQATLSGLGRSTANTNALAAAQAQTELPLMQAEQARRDNMINQAMQTGEVERGVEQSGYNANQADAIRRQNMSEQALFGPMGQMTSTIGQNTTSKNSTSGGGGMSAICTELNHQGLMDNATFEADEKFGEQLPPEVIDGYHLWSKPLVRMMQRSPALTASIAPLALCWAREMKRRITGEGKGSIIGKALLIIGVPICGWLGRRLNRLAERVEGKLVDVSKNSYEKVKFRENVLQLQSTLERMRKSVTTVPINDDFPLEHFFSPIDPKYGCCIYARKIFLPKGSVVVGKIHKHQHLNFIMQGKVSVRTEHGPKYFEAPCIFVSEAGVKRAVYAEEDSIWCTCHLTDLIGEENVERIVDELTVKTYGELGMIDSSKMLSENGANQ